MEPTGKGLAIQQVHCTAGGDRSMRTAGAVQIPEGRTLLTDVSQILMQVSGCSSGLRGWGSQAWGLVSTLAPHIIITCVHLKVLGKSDLERPQTSAFGADPRTLRTVLQFQEPHFKMDVF